jgi:Domain of unknown function (DUF2017)
VGNNGARDIVKINKGPVVRTKHGTYKLDLPKDHCEVLTHLITELRDSLLNTTDDASLRRLFPTAYHNDAKKDAEYQRLMREELLASRLASIETALEVIGASNEQSESEIDAFARSINALRLVIGTTLDIAESDYGDRNIESPQSKSPETDSDEEKLIQSELYDYLGWLLEWTVGAQSEGL